VRSDEGTFLVDGPVLVAEALAAGVELRSLYVEVDAPRPAVQRVVDEAHRAGVRVREVVPGALAKVLDLGSPQSVVAVAPQQLHALDGVLADASASARPLLVLVDVADPGNVGTLVRTAEAAGGAGCVLVGSCADLFNPKTVRATAGALFRVPVATADDLAVLQHAARAHDVALVGTVGAQGSSPESVPLAGPVAILIGSEAHGLPADAVARCDRLVTIPMEGRVESLNAAVAGSVVAFEAARQRRAGSAAGSAEDRSGGRTTAVGHNDDPVATGRPPLGRPAPEHGSPTR
jgi:TrmH family RNA methyltransferase